MHLIPEPEFRLQRQHGGVPAEQLGPAAGGADGALGGEAGHHRAGAAGKQDEDRGRPHRSHRGHQVSGQTAGGQPLAAESILIKTKTKTKLYFQEEELQSILMSPM